MLFTKISYFNYRLLPHLLSSNNCHKNNCHNNKIRTIFLIFGKNNKNTEAQPQLSVSYKKVLLQIQGSNWRFSTKFPISVQKRNLDRIEHLRWSFFVNIANGSVGSKLKGKELILISLFNSLLNKRSRVPRVPKWAIAWMPECPSAKVSGFPSALSTRVPKCPSNV